MEEKGVRGKGGWRKRGIEEKGDRGKGGQRKRDGKRENKIKGEERNKSRGK